MARQKAEFVAGTKTNNNNQLQDILGRKNGEIKGLKEAINITRQKEVHAEDRCIGFEEILKQKDKVIEEHLSTLNEADSKITKLH